MAHEQFDSDIEQLAQAHEKAETTMLSLILSFLTGKATYEQATQGIGQIAQALAQASAEWVQGVLPRIYADGVQTAQKALQTSEDAAQGSPNTQAHSASLRLFQEDLAADLAATTNRMNDDAKASLRNLARQQITEMMASGKNAIPQSREMARQMQEKGVKFTDKSGRRWDAGAYSRLVLRTKAVEVSNQANGSAAREFGSKYMRIRDGGPGDVDEPCKVADGQVWTVEYFLAHLLEHPQCRRAGSPLPSSYSGPVDRGEGATPAPEEAAIDPKSDAVVYDGAGVLFVSEPPTPTPTERDIAALRSAYPDAELLLWGDEDIELPKERDETGAPPVSAAFNNRELPRYMAEPFAETLEAIDSVHKDGELKHIPLEDDGEMNAEGQHVISAKTGETRIKLSPGADNLPLTAVHEIGHLLDRSVIAPDKDGWASESNSPLVEAWREAVMSSAAARRLKEMLLTEEPIGEFSVDRGYISYVYRENEFFARSYAQYIAMRSGNKELARGIENRRRQRPDQLYYPTQWEDEDFEPIAAAFDEMFAAKDWR